MSEERFEAWLKENADEYHRPPADVPREEMWDAIARARQARTSPVAGHIGRRLPLVRYAVAASMLIGAGIGFGYWMRGPVAQAPVASTTRNIPDSVISNTTYEVASVAHLSAVEMMLTSYRATPMRTEDEAAMHRLARDLLATTRLLMDSPAAKDANRRQLLEDLEYVLVQIVQLAPNAPAEDRAIVDRAIAREQVLTRIRSSIPAGFSRGD